MKNKLVIPILKWVGGKRQLLKEIDKYIPKQFTTYYEPFVGGGAVLFHIQPKKAVINDMNKELINLYEVTKISVDELIADLSKHRNDADYFYTIRALDRHTDYSKLSSVEKASRIHYLNKTCFNGLYRVNQAGFFNTPFGNYVNPNIVNEVHIRAVSKYFNSNDIKILNGDYEESLKYIRKGSFVYFDPPYDPISTSSSFTGYTKGGFDREEQKRLKRICDELDRKGVKFLLSNSATPFILDLYKDYKIEIVGAKRYVNANGDGRDEVDEVLVRNYEC